MKAENKLLITHEQKKQKTKNIQKKHESKNENTRKLSQTYDCKKQSTRKKLSFLSSHHKSA